MGSTADAKSCTGVQRKPIETCIFLEKLWQSFGIPPGLLTVTTNRSTKKSSKTAKKRVGSDHNLQFGSRINETLVASHLLRAEPRTPTPKP